MPILAAFARERECLSPMTRQSGLPVATEPARKLVNEYLRPMHVLGNHAAEKEEVRRATRVQGLDCILAGLQFLVLFPASQIHAGRCSYCYALPATNVRLQPAKLRNVNDATRQRFEKAIAIV